MIKAVIFDIGGVLELGKYSFFSFRRHRSLSVHHFMARKFNISIDQWFDSIDTAYAEAIEGKISKKEALSIISKNLSTSPEYLEKLFIKVYKKYFGLNKNLYKIAFELQCLGYKIAILSDQWQVSKEALINSKLSKRFNEVVISCDVGFRKPNPKIFKLIIKRLKLKPSEIVFIDNQKWNTKPARKLGMQTILFKNNKQVIRELIKLGVKI